MEDNPTDPSPSLEVQQDPPPPAPEQAPPPSEEGVFSKRTHTARRIRDTISGNNAWGSFRLTRVVRFLVFAGLPSPTLSQLARFLFNDETENAPDIDELNATIDNDLFFDTTSECSVIDLCDGYDTPSDNFQMVPKRAKQLDEASFMKILTVLMYPMGRPCDAVIQTVLATAMSQVHTSLKGREHESKHKKYCSKDGRIKKKYIGSVKKGKYSGIVFRRALKLIGIKMTRVRNLTDINDNASDMFVVYGALDDGLDTSDHAILIKDGRIFSSKSDVKSNAVKKQLRVKGNLHFHEGNDQALNQPYLKHVSKAYLLVIKKDVSIPLEIRHAAKKMMNRKKKLAQM